MVKTVRYKPEIRGFETRRSKLLLSDYLINAAALGPRVYSASIGMSRRYRDKKYFQRVKRRLARKADNLSTITVSVV